MSCLVPDQQRSHAWSGASSADAARATQLWSETLALSADHEDMTDVSFLTFTWPEEMIVTRMVSSHGLGFADAAAIGIDSGMAASTSLVIKLSSKHAVAPGDRIELLGERVRVLRGFDSADVSRIIFPTVVCESAQAWRERMHYLPPPPPLLPPPPQPLPPPHPLYPPEPPEPPAPPSPPWTPVGTIGDLHARRPGINVTHLTADVPHVLPRPYYSSGFTSVGHFYRTAHANSSIYETTLAVMSCVLLCFAAKTVFGLRALLKRGLGGGQHLVLQPTSLVRDCLATLDRALTFFFPTPEPRSAPVAAQEPHADSEVPRQEVRSDDEGSQLTAQLIIEDDGGLIVEGGEAWRAASICATAKTRPRAAIELEPTVALQLDD